MTLIYVIAALLFVGIIVFKVLETKGVDMMKTEHDSSAFEVHDHEEEPATIAEVGAFNWWLSITQRKLAA